MTWLIRRGATMVVATDSSGERGGGSGGWFGGLLGGE